MEACADVNLVNYVEIDGHGVCLDADCEYQSPAPVVPTDYEETLPTDGRSDDSGDRPAANPKATRYLSFVLPFCPSSRVWYYGACRKLIYGTVETPWGLAAKFARFARIAAAAAKARLAARNARVEFPKELIPAGESQRSWGAKLWGRGADDARALIGARTSDELRELGLDAAAAKKLADFYRSAAKHGRGGQAAHAREALMRSIYKQLKGR